MFDIRNRKEIKRVKPEELYTEVDEYTTEEDYTVEDYNEEEKDYIEEEKESKERKPRRTNKIGIISDIIFIIIMIALILITVDVIAVGKYETGPYFAIPVKTYKDGGSKAYYGLGYKVIKYNQVQGRRDMEIGTWALKYDTNPITVQDLDLTIEFEGNQVATYKKYYKKFVRIISTLHEVDEESRQIKLGYIDEDGKYSMDIVCNMVSDQDNLSSFEEDKEITIIGTVTNYEGRTDTANNRLTVSNCFAQQ